MKVFLQRNVSGTSKIGFYSLRTDGKRIHRSVGLHGAELWPFEVIRLLEEKIFQVFELFLKSDAILGFGIGFSCPKAPGGPIFSLIGLKYTPIWRVGVNLLISFWGY